MAPNRNIKITKTFPNFFNKTSMVLFFQFKFIIMPLTKTAGIMIGKKTRLKYFSTEQDQWENAHFKDIDNAVSTNN